MKKLLCILFISLAFAPSILFGQSKNFKKGKVATKNYYEEIPFEFEKNKIILPVIINNKSYRFLLDTGAPNIISKELAQELNAESIGQLNSIDANMQQQSLNLVRVKSLNLGSVEFLNQSALVFDLNGSEIFKCFKIDGFIGSNLLQKSILQLDAQKRVIRITDKTKRLDLTNAEKIKLELKGDQSSPYIWVDLLGESKAREQLLVDTGKGDLYDIAARNYSILKQKAIFNEIGVSQGASSISLFGEVEKTTTQKRLHLPKLQIGNFQLKNVVTNTKVDNNSKIGAELLNHGVATIDFKNKRFYFQPHATIIDVGEPQLGFEMTLKDSSLVIGYVWDEDLKAKINYGDEIIAIDNKPLEKNVCDYVKRDFDLNSFELRLKTANDSIITLDVKKKAIDSILNVYNGKTKERP